jgi:hypothetical protein
VRSFHSRAGLRLSEFTTWLLLGAAPAFASGPTAKAPADSPLWTSPRPVPDRGGKPDRVICARGDRFEIVTDSGARAMFVRGISLGAGSPGHFPGEFAITKDDYVRWIRFARDLHANAIRVYALHPPAFYQALREENRAHPEAPIWLFQEVWTELPDANDFWDRAFTRGFEDEVRIAIDAIHGNAVVRSRPGHASGSYDADVSPWLAGWLLGREWEPFAVRRTEQLHPDTTRFRGSYFTVDGGTPMEVWLARISETAAAYEAKRYGLAHAVSFVNWPTLDPMRHPTETERGGAQAEHDEDAFSVDPTRIRPARRIDPSSGFLGYFANYHVYPYYPDFMNLDPGYARHRDAHGACSYAGYLTDLKAHTRGIPLLIGEYGVPSSARAAHLQPQGIHHGGATEEEQGAQDVRLFEDIAGTGCAGSLLFALYDEWFKVNWLVQRVERPRDRDPLWHNVLDAEENYGLIGFDPPPAVRIDGEIDDWTGVAPYAKSAGAAANASGTSPDGGPNPLSALYVTSDQTRLYLRIDLAPLAGRGTSGGTDRQPRPHETPPPWTGGALRAIGVSFDVLDPARGDRRLPAPLRATWSRGAEFVLVIVPPAPTGAGSGVFDRNAASDGRAELFIDRAMNYSTYAVFRGSRGYEWSENPFRPVANKDGLYSPLMIETNRERVSRDGTLFPAKHLDWGRLVPRREWAFSKSGSTVEVAIPWGLLNVGDPSSRAVIDDKPGTRETETTTTQGIGLLAWATTATGFAADSLGPARAGVKAARPRDCFFLGPSGTLQASDKQGVTITTPETASYSWNTWEEPITSEHVKRSAARVREVFEGMEARDEPRQTERDAGQR